MLTPSVQTLKSIRKWRDRVFVWRERWLERRQLSGGKNVRFTPWPEAVDSLQRGFAGTRHRFSFGEVPPGGGEFDLVVPVSVEALREARNDAALCRRNPLPLPSIEAIERCDDKGAFVRHLRAGGFGGYVPADVGPEPKFPYMLKRRRDAFARHAYRIGSAADEVSRAAELGSDEFLRQEWIDGSTEFSAHLLFIGGEIRRALTIRFEMAGDHAIRGRDPVRLHRRCRNRHLPLFAAMLRSLGFEGLCCVNFKERAGRPVVLEINPRFGFTLAIFFPVFLRSLQWPR